MKAWLGSAKLHLVHWIYLSNWKSTCVIFHTFSFYIVKMWFLICHFLHLLDYCYFEVTLLLHAYNAWWFHPLLVALNLGICAVLEEDACMCFLFPFCLFWTNNDYKASIPSILIIISGKISSFHYKNLNTVANSHEVSAHTDRTLLIV